MYQFFAPRSSSNSPVRLPEEYRETSRWQPKLGDRFPYCEFTTSQGKKSLKDIASGGWVYFFSMPNDITPVCSAELASFSRYGSDFRDIGVRLVSISRSTIEKQLEWHRMMDAQFGFKVDVLCIEDPELSLAKCFGMVHSRDSADAVVRKSFVIDPSQKIRSIVEYPEEVSRNAAEVLNHVASLQEYDAMSSKIDEARSRPLDPLVLTNASRPVAPKRVSSKAVFRDDLVRGDRLKA